MDKIDTLGSEGEGEMGGGGGRIVDLLHYIVKYVEGYMEGDMGGGGGCAKEEGYVEGYMNCVV